MFEHVQRHLLPKIELEAKRKITDCSLAPIYLFNNSGPLIGMKFNPHSLAIADAKYVFPHPG